LIFNVLSTKFYRPSNKEELFTLRHTSARNVIERIFGVLKQYFCILLLPPAYAMEIQAQIPAALCALHNYIRLRDHSEGHLPADDEDEDVEDGGLGTDMAVEDDVAAIEEDNEEEFCQGSVMRDRIAAAM
jgi:hypothetical protein